MSATVHIPSRRPRPAASVTLGASTSVEGRFKLHAVTLSVQASQAPQLIDLSEAVATAVLEARVHSGHVHVFCMHTTAALVLNEDECLLHRDMADFLEQLASSVRNYRHDDLSIRTENLEPDHGRNGHAHLKQMVLGSSLMLPVSNGRLALGTWQRLFLLELDRPRLRQVLVHVSGIQR